MVTRRLRVAVRNAVACTTPTGTDCKTISLRANCDDIGLVPAGYPASYLPVLRNVQADDAFGFDGVTIRSHSLTVGVSSAASPEQRRRSSR